MRIAADTNCYYGKFSMEETIDIMAGAGFEAIDYSFMNPAEYDGTMDEAKMKERALGLKEYAEEKGLCFNQAHAPCPSSTDKPEETEVIFQNVVRSMRFASYLGVKNIIVHAKQHIPYTEENAAEATFEMNMEFYGKLKKYCEEYDIHVGIENLSYLRQIVAGLRHIHTACSTPEELIRYIDTLNSEHFIVCLDIGHAIVVHQDPADFIRKLGNKRLKALHIHDNAGHLDNHTLPFLGGMADWDGITKALREIQYTGDFNFEAGNFLLKLPKELYPIGAKMMAETGRYLVGKIEGKY